jgi:hypothetical protein
MACHNHKTGWQKCSSMITLGLDFKGAIGATMAGCAFLIVPLLLNGWIGARYRIPCKSFDKLAVYQNHLLLIVVCYSPNRYALVDGNVLCQLCYL